MNSTNPYNYPFIQKDNTMYLSTISTSLFIQPSKISPANLPSIAKVHFYKEISQEQLPRFWSPKEAPLISSFPPISSLSLIEVSISTRHQTLYSLMILKELDQSAQTSEQEE